MSVYSVSTQDADSLTLCEEDKIKSVMQAIRIIITTPKGTVPMHRDFGVDMSFVDNPIPGAEQRARVEIWEAIEKWEPRATVTAITFKRDAAGDGKLIPTIEVNINE